MQLSQPHPCEADARPPGDRPLWTNKRVPAFGHFKLPHACAGVAIVRDKGVRRPRPGGLDGSVVWAVYVYSRGAVPSITYQ